MDMARTLCRIVTGRWFVKLAFLGFFVWSCWRLAGFARWARGEGPFVARPESVAGILPIGHFTSFFAWLKGGGWDVYLPAGLIIIIGAIVTSLLFKRGFCGWICPVGTVWEGAATLGRLIPGGRTLRLPKGLDITGRGVRYLLAAVVLGWLASVPVPEAVAFRQIPYMWVADIKILEGFFAPTFVVVILFTFTVSMLLGPVWCRWLCPLGALYSLFGVASACTVMRDEETCIHCSKCTEVCHAFVDVERARDVRAAECDGCMDCVRACPVDGCLTARFARRVVVPPRLWPLLVAGTWLGIWLFAKVSGNWDTTVPLEAFRQIINSGLLEQQTPGFF